MDRSAVIEQTLLCARTVLANMALENERKWYQFWISRWAINHEPLRNDAGNVVDAIDKLFP